MATTNHQVKFCGFVKPRRYEAVPSWNLLDLMSKGFGHESASIETQLLLSNAPPIRISAEIRLVLYFLVFFFLLGEKSDEQFCSWSQICSRIGHTCSCVSMHTQCPCQFYLAIVIYVHIFFVYVCELFAMVPFSDGITSSTSVSQFDAR